MIIKNNNINYKIIYNIFKNIIQKCNYQIKISITVTLY